MLGASGMLGHAVLRVFAQSPGYQTMGTVRSITAVNQLPASFRGVVVAGVDVENFDSLTRAFAVAKPDVVINCIGLVKQLAISEHVDPCNRPE